MKLKAIITLTFLSLTGLGLTACDANDGSAEQVGERIDDAVHNAQGAIEEAGDRIEDGANTMKENTEEALDDIRDTIDNPE